MTKFEDVKTMTTEEYFNGNQFSIDAFNKKYTTNGMTYVEAVYNVCEYIASAEKTKELEVYWRDRWFDEIFNDYWHPAGSIMQGANSPKKISMSNCTHIGMPKDSLEGIFRYAGYRVAKTAAYRQGLGVDFSKLRPVGSKVYNSSNVSQGVLHWMKLIDSLGNYIGQCMHPDTLILTECGYKSIKEIVETKYSGNIFSIDKKTKVINWFKNPVKKIVKIKTEYGDTLKASEDHKILVYNGVELEKKRISDVVESDFVVCRRTDLSDTIINYVPIDKFEYNISEYNNSNRLMIPKKQPTIIDEKLAYIIGIIYGDGCAYGDNIEIAFSNDWVEIYNKFSAYIYDLFGHNIGDYGTTIKMGAKDTNQGDCTKVLLGKWYYKFFEHINCLKGKSDKLIFPECMSMSPKSVLESFFAGVFDSDGHNSDIRKNISLDMVDGDFLSKLKIELQKFGYVVRLGVKKRNHINSNWKDVYRLSFVGENSLTQLSKIDSEKIKIGNLVGKYDRLKTPYLAGSLGIKVHKFRDINNVDPLSHSKYEKYVGKKTDLYIQKIKNISVEEYSITYDITVDDESHLFVANPFMVSNSGRIPAMLFSISCNHPDLLDFIKVKSSHDTIQNANISIQNTDKFYEAVLADEDWVMEFILDEVKIGDKIYLDERWDDIRLADGDDDGKYFIYSKFGREYEVIQKTEKARKILMLIAENMFYHAEPGIQNIDIAKKYSNSDAVGYGIVGTNACSEQYLEDQGLCVLASIFCDAFYHKDRGYDIDALKKISYSINRFLDNVVEMEYRDGRYATVEQKNNLIALRRNGAGITDIVGLMVLNNVEYGQPDGNAFMEQFMDDYNYFLYQSSIELGKEKGSFLAFNKDDYMKSGFIKQLVERHPDLKFDTMRNVCLSSIAPTGTLSLMKRTSVMSYGIEPAFGIYYWKRTRISGKYEYYFVVPNVVRRIFADNGIVLPMASDTIKDTWDGSIGNPIAKIIDDHKDSIGLKFKGALDINPLDKLDLMAKIQKNVDSSMSVTYTLPEDSKVDDVYNFILEAWKREVKSIAAFPDKKFYGIITFIPFKELAFKLKSENIHMYPSNFSDEELAELHMHKEEISQNLNGNAPKRPKTLDADIYSVTVKGEKYCVAIGLYNGVPYEMFGGLMNGLDFKFKEKKGVIVKEGRGRYKLEIGELVVENFAEQFKPAEQMLFRMVSTSMRHGVPLKFLVEQLQKSTTDITSIASAASRILKKYIVDGEKATGMVCPSCGSTELIYQEGCVSCSNCNWSKCS